MCERILDIDTRISLFSPLQEIAVLLWSIIFRMGYECVINFHIVHCQALFRISIYSGKGLRWCQATSASNNPEFVKYTTVLNVVSDMYIVGVVQMSTKYLYMKHFNCR